jgi:hypothetical protein
MASNKIIRFGPVALTSSASNIINPPTLTGGTGLAGSNTATYVIIRQIVLLNKTASPATISMYLGASGASAAGTEFLVNATSLPANTILTFNGLWRLDATDFLTGLANANTTITFEAAGEIGVA